MTTPYRGYSEIPDSVNPDVPYRTNLALREIDADIHDVATESGAARDRSLSAEGTSQNAYNTAQEVKLAAGELAEAVARFQADLDLLDGDSLAETVADAQEAAATATAAAAAALAPAAAAVNAAITTPGTDANKHLKAFYGTPVVMLTPDRFPAIDNTGATDTTAALSAAWNAAPFGSTVVLVGSYKIGNLVIDPTKFYSADVRFGTFITANANSALQCVGSYESQIGVSAIVEELVNVENYQTTLTKLTLSSAPGWKRGDVIKLLADDLIPAGHVTSDTDKARVGEQFTVYSSAGTTVYLHGVVTEPYSINIRAARMVPGSITLIEPTFDVTDARLTGKIAGNMIRLDSLVGPRVIKPTLKRLVGMGVSLKSCHGAVVEDPYSFTGIDNTDLSVLSYSIHDSGCTDTIVRGGVLVGGRHAFTDGTGLVPAGSEDTASYGATINAKLIGVTGKYMGHAVFDTHHMSKGVQFIDCTAFVAPGEDAFLARGRNVRVVNPIVYGGKNVIDVLNQVTGTWSTGESYGHELVNPRSFGTQRVATVTTHTATTHPKYGQKDTNINLVIHGGYHEGLRRACVQENSQVRWTVRPYMAWGTLAEGAWFELKNSNVFLPEAYLDGRAITTIAATGTQRVFYANDDTVDRHSEIHLGRVTIAASATYIAAVANPLEVTANTSRVHIERVTFETPWPTTNPFNIPETVRTSLSWGCSYDPANATSRNSSSGATFTNSALAGSIERLCRATDPGLVLTANISDATARTMTTLPLGKFDGQRLTIIMGSATAGLTIPHGASYNTRLIGSVNKVLSTGNAACHLVWSSGAWRE